MDSMINIETEEGNVLEVPAEAVVIPEPAKKARKNKKKDIVATESAEPAKPRGKVYNEEGFRRCPRCGEFKDPAVFGKNGTRSYCNPCNSNASKESRAKHRPAPVTPEAQAAEEVVGAPVIE
jgi:hypothetical protein